MVCRSCRKKVQDKLPPGVRVVSLKDEPEELFSVRYLGPSEGILKYVGPSGRSYRFSRGEYDTQTDVPFCDASFFALYGWFEVVGVEVIAT